MARIRKRWSQGTRSEVLLRCFFRCTSPGCLKLAADLHHGVLHSTGGSDFPDNIIGLCGECHKWVHGSKEREQVARRWLADQIENCPVRIDNVTRSALFEEVIKATKSVVEMREHTNSVYRSDSWNAYEVFLKAAWEFLKLEGRTYGRTASVLLYHFVNLYRRRPGIRYNRAAVRFLKQLKATYKARERYSVA